MKAKPPRQPKRMINPPAQRRVGMMLGNEHHYGLHAWFTECVKYGCAPAYAPDKKKDLEHELSLTHIHYQKKLGIESLACELNMQAYEDAQMHALTEHSLLTEANAEIEKLRIELAGATGESWGYLAANGHLNDYIDELRAEVAQWKRRKFWWDRYQKQQETITALTEANKELRESLDRYEKFNVRSKALG